MDSLDLVSGFGKDIMINRLLDMKLYQVPLSWGNSGEKNGGQKCSSKVGVRWQTVRLLKV